MKVVIQFCAEVFAVQTIIAMTATSSTTTVEQGVLSSTTSTTSSRSSFSRRSATYTASTFTAFEYESKYEYHGIYDIETTRTEATTASSDQTDYVKSDLEIENQSSLMPSMSSRHSSSSSEKTSTKLFDDFDDLLKTLTADEVAELSVVDPDVRMSQIDCMCTRGKSVLESWGTTFLPD